MLLVVIGSAGRTCVMEWSGRTDRRDGSRQLESVGAGSHGRLHGRSEAGVEAAAAEPLPRVPSPVSGSSSRVATTSRLTCGQTPAPCRRCTIAPSRPFGRDAVAGVRGSRADVEPSVPAYAGDAYPLIPRPPSQGAPRAGITSRPRCLRAFAAAGRLGGLWTTGADASTLTETSGPDFSTSDGRPAHRRPVWRTGCTANGCGQENVYLQGPGSGSSVRSPTCAGARSGSAARPAVITVIHAGRRHARDRVRRHRRV